MDVACFSGIFVVVAGFQLGLNNNGQILMVILVMSDHKCQSGQTTFK